MNKRWITFAIKLVVSVTLIWALISHVDLSGLVDRVAQARWTILAGAVSIMVVQVLIVSARWAAVLDAVGTPLPLLEVAKITYIGSFFNQTLPSSVGGDAVRMYGAYKAGIKASVAVTSIMVDRLATFVGLVFVVIAVQPFLISRVSDRVGLWAFILLAVAGLGLLVVVMLLDRLPASFRRWRAVRGLAKLAEDTRAVFMHPKHAVKVLSVSFLSLANLSFTLYLVALALGLGDKISFVDCLALFPPIMLIMTVPVSIAGWGVREGAMVGAFGLIGVPGADALALSMILGGVNVVSSLPGGLLFLMARERKIEILNAKDDNI